MYIKKKKKKKKNHDKVIGVIHTYFSSTVSWITAKLMTIEVFGFK